MHETADFPQNHGRLQRKMFPSLISNMMNGRIHVQNCGKCLRIGVGPVDDGPVTGKLYKLLRHNDLGAARPEFRAPQFACHKIPFK